MDDYQWKFEEYAQDSVISNSQSEKQTREIQKTKVLIRETVQNSLDAVFDKEKPTEIKISYRNIKFKDIFKYFKTLIPHLEECGIKGKELLKLGTEIKFLIIEDFNTKGLEDERKQDFFKKDNLRTEKNSKDGGSHGIGKIVFSASSKIKTFFAFSIFKENGELQNCFKGKSNLESHFLIKKGYREYGFLENLENEDQLKDLLFQRKNETGLSVAIPFYDNEEITTQKIKDAFLKEYYLPLIKDELKIIVDDKEITKNEIISQKVDLAKKYIGSSDEETIFIEKLDYKKKDGILIKNEDEIISLLEDGKSIFIKFNLTIEYQPYNDEDKEGNLILLIQKNKNDEKEPFDFWRDNNLIREASKRQSSSNEYFIIILIEDNPLSYLLRDLENVAHTKWEYQNLDDKIKR